MNPSLSTLPAHELLARMHALVRTDRAVEADLLAHLGEVDARRLYLEEGCSSMFDYCCRVLHFAEAVAFKRIRVARAGRRFPELLAAVRRGELHVTAVSLLAPHLTRESHGELIRAARHRSADDIRRLLADREPKPEVPASVHRLPEPARAVESAYDGPAAPVGAGQPGQPGQPAGGAIEVQPAAAVPTPTPRTTPAPAATSPQPRAEPLGGERYAVRFTADGELFGQLQELRALLRHQIPDGDVGKILARAVAVLLEQVRRRKFGECAKPRPAKSSPAGSERPSRHIPAAVRRAVARRDAERCSYVSPSGRRCEAREFLEFDHREPWVRTRAHPTDGIRLFCRAHNQHAARKEFGQRHMARFSRRSRTRCAGSGGPGEAAPAPVPSAQLDLDPPRGG